jgi:DNA-directed RNA polymerase subunit RPC12/RpoP
MPARRKLDLEKIRASLNTVCPYCSASIPPEDQNRMDWEHMKCPHCGKDFIPEAKDGPPIRTS